MKRLGSQASRLQVIFITVDPERDSPAVLREYPRAFHPSFIGLHADLATTEATAKTFKVFYRKVPTGCWRRLKLDPLVRIVPTEN